MEAWTLCWTFTPLSMGRHHHSNHISVDTKSIRAFSSPSSLGTAFKPALNNASHQFANACRKNTECCHFNTIQPFCYSEHWLTQPCTNTSSTLQWESATSHVSSLSTVGNMSSAKMSGRNLENLQINNPGGQMAEWLGNRDINQKVAGSILLWKMTCPWARHFILFALGNVPVLTVSCSG